MDDWPIWVQLVYTVACGISMGYLVPTVLDYIQRKWF